MIMTFIKFRLSFQKKYTIMIIYTERLQWCFFGKLIFEIVSITEVKIL